ncbi:MAG: rhomboid family intramembrane serine protease [Flavobacteriales bacterium]
MSNGDLLNELKRMYREGSVLMRLIYINVGVFLVIRVLALFLFLFNIHPDPLNARKGGDLAEFIHNWVASTADLPSLMTHPWSVVSYMFLHVGFLHLLFNMLVLYFSGSLFLQYLGSKRMTAMYILGGLGGVFLFILSYNIFPQFWDDITSPILGASAAVVAILIGIATYRPNFEVYLMFIPIPIRLKWIGIGSVLVYLLNIQGANAGGHIAHIGGAIVGFWTINRLKSGNTDILMRFYNFLSEVPEALGLTRQPRMKVKHKSKKAKSGAQRARYMTDEQYNASKKAEQEEIDKILDKISKSGYESLTKKEKETLFRASKDK